MNDILILVGLGNPELKYKYSRHNLGFMVVDAIHNHYGFHPWYKSFHGLVSHGYINITRLILLKPLTYMNLSGKSVKAICNFYKDLVSQIVVIHDDIDLLPSKLKIKLGGCNGGHKGLESIDNYFGKNYWRIRCGIGRPEEKALVVSYVLNSFTEHDQIWLKKLSFIIIDLLPTLIGNIT